VRGFDPVFDHGFGSVEVGGEPSGEPAVVYGFAQVDVGEILE
jgi:hypothetical protein